MNPRLKSRHACLARRGMQGNASRHPPKKNEFFRHLERCLSLIQPRREPTRSLGKRLERFGRLKRTRLCPPLVNFASAACVSWQKEIRVRLRCVPKLYRTGRS
jgi:hypothetical protein